MSKWRTLIERIEEILRQLIPYDVEDLKELPMNQNGDYNEELYLAAFQVIDTDVSPDDEAPDTLGCVESLSKVIQRAFPDLRFPTYLSTRALYDHFVRSPSWKQIDAPKKGCVILSVTGTGNGKIKNGHCGVVGQNIARDGSQWVMSNNSNTGRWDVAYTVYSWNSYFYIKGSMETLFWERA